MQSLYQLTLYNRLSSLDLRTQDKSIGDVIFYILSQSRQQRAYRDVSKIRVLEIRQHDLKIEVNEDATYWHTGVGKLLANNYGMREFCRPRSSQMFKWVPLT